MKIFDGDKLEKFFQKTLPLFLSAIGACILLLMGSAELSKSGGNFTLAILYFACGGSIGFILNLKKV